jgi:hypothetical protein
MTWAGENNGVSIFTIVLDFVFFALRSLRLMN